MADRTNDERLREITVIAARERARVEEIKRLRAELDAARARIAKLEQEPPMALVDFGVGVNWKGLHEDMQQLRAERDAARAEVERLRADLREALSLLRDSGDVRICDRCCENADTVKEAGKWEKKCDALLAKHKETP